MLHKYLEAGNRTKIGTAKEQSVSQTNKGLKVSGEGGALVFSCSLCYLATDDTNISTVLTGRETLNVTVAESPKNGESRYSTGS